MTLSLIRFSRYGYSFMYVLKKYKILPLNILICFKTKISGEFIKAVLYLRTSLTFQLPKNNKQQIYHLFTNASSKLTVMVEVERDNFFKISDPLYNTLVVLCNWGQLMPESNAISGSNDFFRIILRKTAKFTKCFAKSLFLAILKRKAAYVTNQNDFA